MQYTHRHTHTLGRHTHPVDTHRLVCWQCVSHVIFLLPRPNLLPPSFLLSLCWTLGIQNKRPANRINKNNNKNKAELGTLCKHKTYKIEFICRKHISHTKRSTSQKKQEVEVEEKEIQAQEKEKPSSKRGKEMERERERESERETKNCNNCAKLPS